MNRKLNRRIFLRGLGGAVVAAPYLSSIAERQARAADMPVDGPPKRLIVMFTHYGCLTDRWFPAKSHGALAASDFAGTTLEPLGEFADKLLMPRGIRALNQWHANAGLGQGNDPHTQVVGTYFTCQPVTPHTDNPFSFEAATKFNARPVGPSLDHVCAQQVSRNGTPLFMQLGGVTTSGQSSISYESAETPFAGIDSPTQQFNALTQLFGGGQMSPDTYRVARGESVIDIVRDDLDSLMRIDMSSEDKQKLQAWMALLDSAGKPYTPGAHCSEDVATMLGLPGGAAGQPRVDEGDYTDRMFALAALTALCDDNRVIFIKFPPNYLYRGLELSEDSHNISHRLPDAGMMGQCIDNHYEKIQAIDTFYATKFRDLVALLNSFDEGNGTLLDNSATVWFQEMSDGSAHNLNNLPILQAGSCGGYFKVGQAVNVEDGAADMSRGNSTRDCDTGNVDVNAAPTPRDIANRPINKYFCNLMNAIGVKAGSDGYPAVGGTQEVTHFGRYDRTEDFVGADVDSGSANPPHIEWPGEYTELRGNA